MCDHEGLDCPGPDCQCPCMNCLWAEPGMSEEEQAAYERYLETELGRGEMAFQPETMECYGCGGFNGRDFVVRKVVKLGAVLEPHRDPTQSYVLECGHTMI